MWASRSSLWIRGRPQLRRDRPTASSSARTLARVTASSPFPPAVDRPRFVAQRPSERPARIRPISGDAASVPESRSGPVRQRRLTQAEADAFGPLASIVADASVIDVFVNGGGGLEIDCGDGWGGEGLWWEPSERALRDLAVRIVAAGGRHLDEATPCIDVRIGDGIRVHAVLAPISQTGTLLSIRAPRIERVSLADLRASGFLFPEADAVIDHALTSRSNLLVSGAGGSGKTTFLGALLGAADARERIVVIEDVGELRIDHPHTVYLEARQANLEGAGRVSLDRLVREALRMRPDRLVIGECRGSEIRELLTALNTGHDGGAGTLHANSLADVPTRLEALGALAGMSAAAVARQAVSALDLVMHLERRDGVRQLVDIGELGLDARGSLTIASVRSGERLVRS